MRRLRLIWPVGLVVAALAALPAVARAASPVITDCSRHDKLTRHYTVAQLSYALSHLPATVSEYSSCQPLIQQQLLAQVRGGRSGRATRNASGGSSPLVPIVIVVAVIVLAGGGLALVARRRALSG